MDEIGKFCGVINCLNFFDWGPKLSVKWSCWVGDEKSLAFVSGMRQLSNNYLPSDNGVRLCTNYDSPCFFIYVCVYVSRK